MIGIELIVVGIRTEATEMVTIFFERRDGLRLEYRAGQFLTLLFLFGDREVRRSYSFSSAPGVDGLAAITVKRVANGEVSRFLCDRLRVGDVVRSLPAAGKFVLEAGFAGTLVFLAAGSGMVPVFSLIKSVVGTGGVPGLGSMVGSGSVVGSGGVAGSGSVVGTGGVAGSRSLVGSRIVGRAHARMILITQNRDVESVPFRVALRRMVDDGWLEWDSLLSGVAPVVRLNNGLLQEMLKDIRGDEHFYLCGPVGFMRMAVFTLRLLGVGEEQIRRENFTVEYVAPAPVLADVSPKRVVVRVRMGAESEGVGSESEGVRRSAEGGGVGSESEGEGVRHAEEGGGVGRALVGERRLEFETKWPSTILQSALDRGIALPYSCKGGVCSSCVARCVSGRVKMSKNEVLTEKDLAAGLVLTCVGYAETDVELEL